MLQIVHPPMNADYTDDKRCETAGPSLFWCFEGTKGKAAAAVQLQAAQWRCGGKAGGVVHVDQTRPDSCQSWTQLLALGLSLSTAKMPYRSYHHATHTCSYELAGLQQQQARLTWLRLSMAGQTDSLISCCTVRSPLEREHE